ncbi:unnamed protein product, partial [Ectocarpus sp. 4 AP-2014]
WKFRWQFQEWHEGRLPAEDPTVSASFPSALPHSAVHRQELPVLLPLHRRAHGAPGRCLRAARPAAAVQAAQGAPRRG